MDVCAEPAIGMYVHLDISEPAPHGTLCSVCGKPVAECLEPSLEVSYEELGQPSFDWLRCLVRQHLIEASDTLAAWEEHVREWGSDDEPE